MVDESMLKVVWNALLRLYFTTSTLLSPMRQAIRRSMFTIGRPPTIRTRVFSHIDVMLRYFPFPKTEDELHQRRKNNWPLYIRSSEPTVMTDRVVSLAIATASIDGWLSMSVKGSTNLFRWWGYFVHSFDGRYVSILIATVMSKDNVRDDSRYFSFPDIFSSVKKPWTFGACVQSVYEFPVYYI